MRVQFRIVGRLDAEGHQFADHRLELDAVPRLGELVNLPAAGELSVRTVVWYPLGDPDVAHTVEPFAYVVVGEPRGLVGQEAGR